MPRDNYSLWKGTSEGMELVFKTCLAIPWWQQRGGDGELPGAPAAGCCFKQNFISGQNRRDVRADFSVP